MKYLLSFAGLLAMALAASAADSIAYISADKVAAGFMKGGNIATGAAFAVQTSRRVKAGNPEAHAFDDEIMYVVDGEATLVTGGTMIGGKQSGPGQWRGIDIRDGKSQHLAKGDVVVIPAGIPHWFKEVPQSISYYVVKSVKP